MTSAALCIDGDERCGLAGGRFDLEPLDVFPHDGAGALGLGGTMAESTVGPVAQVVEIEHRDTGQVGDAGLDVAWHGDVDDVQRTSRPRARSGRP